MRIFVVLFLFSLPALSFGSGIDFFHGNFEEALAMAKEEGKVIFVDTYTTWCGPCKRMSRNVFTDSEVGTFYNKHFVNLKLDMEKKDGIQFGGKYPVSAYPTLYFIDAKGEVVQKVKGAQSVDAFLSLGKSILSKVDFSKDYAVAYEAGDRDPELILNYVKALNKVGKPSGKIVNDYLKSQKDLSTPFNSLFLYEALAEADSRIFDLYVDHKKHIIKQKSETEYLKKIEAACEQTIRKAIEYDTHSLVDEAKEKMKKNYPEAQTAFAFNADMSYAAFKKDKKAYIKSANGMAKKVFGKNALRHYELSQRCLQDFPRSQEVTRQAIAFGEKAVQLQNKPEYGFHVAQLYLKNNQKEKAISTAKDALALCEENSSLAGQIKRFIHHISA
ncbi:MAG: thioredoxin fold domain-containing protein [Saprospiraceae bacterium]|nr:thioredoxin fold domain-containing protein [Saprospiraceae bacterium]